MAKLKLSEPPAPRGMRLNVNVSLDEMHAFQEAATAAGLTLSAWVRLTLRAASRKP